MLKSVMLIHEIAHRIDFSYLAEMFRFLGVFVCEEILLNEGFEETLTENKGNCDVYIYVGSREISKEEEEVLGCTMEKYSRLTNILPSDTIYFGDILSNKGMNRPLAEGGFPKPIDQCFSIEQNTGLIYDFLEEVLRLAYKETYNFKVDQSWQNLLQVFIQNRLYFHSMNLQYYPKQPSDGIGSAKKAFIEGYRQLVALGENVKNEAVMHYKYAVLWCSVKTNVACDYQKDIAYFPINGLAKKCQELCKEYSDFTNSKILLGMCYEPSIGSGNEALMAFNQALKEVNKSCFASAVYYWMGKRFETFTGKEEDAAKCYELANKRKEKFRNYFKLAVIERNKGNYNKAIELFNVILAKLERKLNMQFADPLELEYAFKVFSQECYIYSRINRYEKVIEMGEKAIWLREEVIDKDEYFSLLYGKEASEYREILKKRLKLTTAYRLLTETYRELRNKEKEKEYFEKWKSVTSE